MEPDIANAVQQLAKVMDGATELHVKMMEQSYQIRA